MIEKIFLLIFTVTYMTVVMSYDDETPLCFAKYDGVCVEDYDPCPFEQSTEVNGGKNEKICNKEHQKCCKPVNLKEKPEKRNTKCGISRGSKFKVFGGWRSMPGEWPWQVQIAVDGVHHCGGAIFHPNWVISAAHCFIFDTEINKFLIRAGKTQLNTTEKPEQNKKIKRVINHPGFDVFTVSDDIALIQLEQPFRFDYKYVAPICLPNIDEKFDDNVCTLTGYGKTEKPDQDFSNYLLEVNLPIVNESTCAVKHCGSKTIYKENICAGFQAGVRDACTGDSGGPIVCEKISVNGNKQFVLAGVVSHGSGCADKDTPGIYTRITSYLDWIESETGIAVYNGSFTGSKKFIPKTPRPVVSEKCKMSGKL